MTSPLGFGTYVFIERQAANAAVLHPFPEHNVGAVRDALADAGYEISILGGPAGGEGIYFSDEPFGDEVLGELADALTLRGIGAYAYALIQESLGPEVGGIALFTRVGRAFPLEGRRIVMCHMWLGHEAGAKTARTWVFGSPADLEEADILLGSRFSTEPVHDPNGMAAIEITHDEYSAGTQEAIGLMDQILQILGGSGFEGPAFCNEPTA